MTVVKRKYLTINDIYKEYLPVSKKRIRKFVKLYLPTKLIGGRIYTGRKIGNKVISGVFYIVGIDKYNNLTSLTENNKEKYREMFWNPQTISV